MYQIDFILFSNDTPHVSEVFPSIIRSSRLYIQQQAFVKLEFEVFGIISKVKPTRCTNVSNLFYFGKTLNMFRRSFRPSSGVQDCTYSNRHLSNRYYCLLASSLASRQQYLFDKCLLLYVQS
jgi:hypothetical protein